ncbi:MAG: hypothetical protein F6K35_50590 [Okeania sp. SIO2H7]|nr:hypothetical protein [Okeania sp. SIO2H7]
MDVAALEEMPLDALQTVVQDLKRDLEKNARFVSSQEEELTLQQQDIDALKQKIAAASEYDRLQLETELSDEQESYRMLNETLVGQRRNVQEREAILHRHEAVLARRQGLPSPSGIGSGIDLSPALGKVEQLYGQLSSEVDALRQQVEELEHTIATQEGTLQQQEEEVQQQKNALLEQEQGIGDKRLAAAEMWGKVNIYQELLQSTQDILNGLRDKCSEMEELAAQSQTVVQEQSQSVMELQNAINTLTADAAPQLAAS